MQDEKSDDRDMAAALRAALRDPKRERETMRTSVRHVLAAHFAQLVDEASDRWPGQHEPGEPGYFPSDALRDLSIGECSLLDHIDAVTMRLLARLGTADNVTH